MDVRDFIQHLPPDGQSAIFREQHPKSWWWTAEIDFLAAILHTVQLANWQRSGKGQQPKPIKRPEDRPTGRRGGTFEPQSAADLAERRKQMRERHNKKAVT